MTVAKPNSSLSVVVLSGGVGGAKLVDGLYRRLGAALTVVVNTGDDFEHWGLQICPDLDTVVYTLGDHADQDRGWGRRDETWACRDAMGLLQGPTWFNLGDRDLATHLLRTQQLRAGRSLTATTAEIARKLGVSATVLPMTDRPRSTVLELAAGGSLPFQQWLVRERAPAVCGFRYEGEEQPTSLVRDAIDSADAVILAPSNPFVSLLPIVTLQGVVASLTKRQVIAVSPIVGGKAVKGPLAAMIPELRGVAPSAQAISAIYADVHEELVNTWVVEAGDGFRSGSAHIVEGSTVMRNAADRVALADLVLDLVTRSHVV